MYLGIDLGTSGVKALLIDSDQQVVGIGHGALDCAYPHPGWSEQDPAAWIAATETALAELKKNAGEAYDRIAGIGLSGQMHGATLLDAEDKVLRPAILWNDTRSHQEATALDDIAAFRELTGNIVFPGFTAPKIAWVRKHEPEIFDKIAKVLLPKDYLRLWLTGEYIADMSDSAGTSWLDVARRSWSDVLLGETGLTREQMPALCEGTEIAGKIRPEIADRIGIKAGTPVAGGAGDNAATACGLGKVSGGSGFASLGTSGVLFAATDRYLPNADSAVHTFCHCLPDTWHQMGVILSATNSLNWYATISGQDPATLTGELGETLMAPEETMFLPYLSGERTPHNDANARGVFLGLSHKTDRPGMTRAVLEGVAFAFADNLRALSHAGTRLDRVLAVGGGSRSRYWLKALATVMKMPVDLPASGEQGAAFGAARLGLIAAEGADPRAVCTAPDIADTIEPEADLIAPFAEKFAAYRAAYSGLRGHMK